MVDASIAFRAVSVKDGFDVLRDPALFAPPLMWSEARSTLRAAWWRGQLEPDDAEEARERLERCPVQRQAPPELGTTAWSIASELGWAKTYDAEYLALARLLGCRVVTLDARLRRAAERLELVVGPDEL